MQRRGKNIALATAVLALLTAAAAFYLGRARLDDWFRSWRRRPLPVLSKANSPVGQQVDISHGNLMVPEILRFLGDYTGLPVIYDASDSRIAGGNIGVVADMHDVDAEVVRALLEASGYRVDVDDLPGGKQALRVTATR